MCEDAAMARKPKKKVFSAAKVLREMAREVVAKKAKPERHKTTLRKLLADE